jgi:hypothetical protein
MLWLPLVWRNLLLIGKRGSMGFPTRFSPLWKKHSPKQEK